MRFAKYAALLAIVAVLCLAAPPGSQAKVAAQFGPAPDCPYGYYDYAPYNCAPYSYYGPEWFPHGVFIGAGPWFHGPKGFRGRIDNHYDVRHGYQKRLPHRGQHARHHSIYDFHATSSSDAHGHYSQNGTSANNAMNTQAR